MRMSRVLKRSILVGLLIFFGVAVATAEEEAAVVETSSPAEVVESIHEALIECMKGSCGPGFQARYDRIVAELDEGFDLPFMARISIGRAWQALSPAQRKEFVELSRRYSAANYASNFDGYSDQSFKTLGEEPAARGTILVKTEFVQPTDDNVKFDYRLRKTNGRWRVIDVTLDGKVSEMTLRRADYTSVIDRDGYPALVEAVQQKINNYANE
ncbi:MAG: ABC transporter substrate-binding protein [Myxococcota bacterium]|nr:ABC transporter substrate-binding protein [Myxococcota bacterium]